MYTIGQLSKKTGVTTRTLDYYDEIGLLTPSAATNGGYRLYDNDNVMRLEQILALKYMGFSLQQVQEILTQSTSNWEHSLEQQLKMIQKQQEQLKALEHAVKGVLFSIRFDEEIKWPVIFDVIHMFQKDTNAVQHLLEDYFNPDEQETVKNVGEQMDEKNFLEWKEIFHEIRMNIKKDPGSETAQDLARRWMEKVDAMFSGDEALELKMWEAIKDSSNEAAFYPMDEDVVNFIDRAVKIMYEREDGSSNDEEKENHQRGE